MELVATESAAAGKENFERGVDDKLQKEKVADNDKLQKEKVADDDKLQKEEKVARRRQVAKGEGGPKTTSCKRRRRRQTTTN